MIIPLVKNVLTRLPWADYKVKDGVWIRFYYNQWDMHLGCLIRKSVRIRTRIYEEEVKEFIKMTMEEGFDLQDDLQEENEIDEVTHPM